MKLLLRNETDPETRTALQRRVSRHANALKLARQSDRLRCCAQLKLQYCSHVKLCRIHARSAHAGRHSASLRSVSPSLRCKPNSPSKQCSIACYLDAEVCSERFCNSNVMTLAVGSSRVDQERSRATSTALEGPGRGIAPKPLQRPREYR